MIAYTKSCDSKRCDTLNSMVKIEIDMSYNHQGMVTLNIGDGKTIYAYPDELIIELSKAIKKIREFPWNTTTKQKE